MTLMFSQEVMTIQRYLPMRVARRMIFPIVFIITHSQVFYASKFEQLFQNIFFQFTTLNRPSKDIRQFKCHQGESRDGEVEFC